MKNSISYGVTTVVFKMIRKPSGFFYKVEVVHWSSVGFYLLYEPLSYC